MHNEDLTPEITPIHNSDQEIITVNKTKLIDDILTLMAVVFITGVSIGATIVQLIIHFS